MKDIQEFSGLWGDTLQDFAVPNRRSLLRVNYRSVEKNKSGLLWAVKTTISRITLDCFVKPAPGPTVGWPP
jgi:hypothetical protein